MIKLIILLIVLTVVSSKNSIFTEEDYRNTFVKWMMVNERQYSNEEFLERFKIFKWNMDFVFEWNSQGSETILGLNLFADLSNDEYQRIYLNPIYDVKKLHETDLSHQIFNDDYLRHSNDYVPGVEVDWRTKGAVSEVKNQGACGSCWSFSTTGVIESHHYMTTGNMVLLSEQNLMDCSFPYGNNGCGGGAVAPAFKYIIENGGIDTEHSYPYKAQANGTEECRFNASNVGATISNYNFVLPFFSEKALAYNVKNFGPISVSIDAAQNSFQLYESGIYYDSRCSQTFLTHDVLCVGFGSGSFPSSSEDSQSNSWTGGPVSSSASASTASQPGSQSGSQTSSQTSSASESSAYQTSGSMSAGWSASITGSQQNPSFTTSTPMPSTSGSGSGSTSNPNNYWIVKNSWTKKFGVDGYIYMSKDRDNNCGIASYAKRPIM